MMRVCVAGAGTIGSLFAAHLARVAEVSVLTRREEHARALNDQGLRVTGRADFTASVIASADPSALPEPELVVVACKGSDLDALAERLAGRFAAATLMTVQNGLGAEEVAGAHGAWPLLSAVTFMSGTRHGDTQVEYVLDTETWIGPYRGTTPADAQAVADLIVSSGLKAAAFDDLRPAQWSKLIFNATVNAVAALTGLAHDFHFAEVERAGDLGLLVRGLQRGHPHSPSMLEDVRAHRPTEIESITGSLVREAAKHGVPAPLHTALYALVKAKEASY